MVAASMRGDANMVMVTTSPVRPDTVSQSILRPQYERLMPQTMRMQLAVVFVRAGASTVSGLQRAVQCARSAGISRNATSM